ncbi:MAG: hypothetical protein ACD_39C00099G0002 [uncultured bacterium]|nr:MAG: hypothetical protein ACD_39C00099G0002 [uncultured bacterium]
MDKNKQGLGVRIRYSFDNFMSKGGLSVFAALMLLFVSAIILMAIVRYGVNLIAPQENMTGIFDNLWLSFLQIADGGAIGEDTNSNSLHRLVGIFSLFLGMVLFSSLVAFITSQFEAMMVNMRKGKSEVIESGHSLILGFGDRVLEIIRELIIANESKDRAAIVVLSSNEKDEMDDFFNDKVADPKTTQIICRSGSTSSIQDLSRVGVKDARSIIILNDATVDADRETKELADARVLKTILAVMSCVGETNLPSIVAEIHLPNKQKLAKNLSPRISIIDEHSILAKLMVHTSRTSGLAKIYDELVGFQGSEFYFYRPDKGWNGMNYSTAMFHFENCSVLGIRSKNGDVKVNPPGDTVLDDKTELILLAEDDSAINFSKDRFKTNDLLGEPAKPLAKTIEKQLIVGWSQKTMTIISEYCKYLIKGSGIDLILADPTDETKEKFAEIQTSFPDINMHLITAEVDNQEFMLELKPEKYDNVIILSGDGGVAELRDSDTIAKLLEFRHYFKNNIKGELKTQLITEVADSQNIEVIQAAGVKDFLISNQFVSKIYAQVGEEQDVLKVYEDLFSEEGSEVYIKPIKLFTKVSGKKVSFGDLCAAAAKRGESCFGLCIAADSNDRSKNYGFIVNPPKAMEFTVTGEDSLITLAEDET